MASSDLKTLMADCRRQAAAGSGEHAALAVFLHGADPRLLGEDFVRHVSRHGADWDAVLAEGWSNTEQILLATAASLWRSSGHPVSIGSAVAYLDDRQYALWQAMITGARTSEIPDAYR